jgi:hypothetical protein
MVFWDFLFVFVVEPAIRETLVEHNVPVDVHKGRTTKTTRAVVITFTGHTAVARSCAVIPIATAIEIIVAFLAIIPTCVVALPRKFIAEFLVATVQTGVGTTA